VDRGSDVILVQEFGCQPLFDIGMTGWAELQFSNSVDNCSSEWIRRGSDQFE